MHRLHTETTRSSDYLLKTTMNTDMVFPIAWSSAGRGRVRDGPTQPRGNVVQALGEMAAAAAAEECYEKPGQKLPTPSPVNLTDPRRWRPLTCRGAGCGGPCILRDAVRAAARL